MYQVSESYLEQMMHHGTRRRLSGTVGSVAFTGNDVVKDSFNISSMATEESDTKIGGVFLGQLDITFVPSFLQKVARDQYKDKEVSIYIGLLVTEEGEDPTWVDIPIGVYTLQAPKISKQGISVTGYDHMYKLDKKFSIDQSTGTPYSFLSFMATECGVTLGNNQAEIEALPNGTEVLGLHENNDIETWRDFLYWLAQACGCFACADRDGNIVLRKFGVENDVEFDENHRDADVVFSGYITKWTGISVVNIDTQMTMYYGLEVDDGLTMNLGANPLLQLGTSEAVNRRRRAVLNAIAEIQYTPFYVNSARDPIYDLGDEINFTGGLSGNCTGCVMALTFTLNNYNFEGYGDDPALVNARSKTDKNIAGLLQNTVENEVTYYNFANVESISFGSDQETTIASLTFTSAQQTTVKILHEFIMDIEADLASDCSYELRYYLDNELVTYKPYERIQGIQSLEEGETTEFSICRDFFYVLKDVTPSIRHTWKVNIIAHGIEGATIDVGNAHVTLEGQRMYGEDYFDGFVEVSEDIMLIPLGNLEFVSTSDTVEFVFKNVVMPTGNDNITLIEISGMQIATITDTIQVFKESLKFKKITENGYPRLTEDGKRRITE